MRLNQIHIRYCTIHYRSEAVAPNSLYIVHVAGYCLTYDMTDYLKAMKNPQMILFILYLVSNERLINRRAFKNLVFKHYIHCMQ